MLKASLARMSCYIFNYVLAYRALPLLITGLFNVGHYSR